jgi:hypothetical protein
MIKTISLFFLILFLFQNQAYSQKDSILFYATIKNQQFEPLPYSNIDFFNKKQNGTVSNEQGFLKLNAHLMIH